MHSIDPSDNGRESADIGATSPSTRDLAASARDELQRQHLILGNAHQDYTAAALLDVLVQMHDETGIDIETLPQVREFSETVLGVLL